MYRIPEKLSCLSVTDTWPKPDIKFICHMRVLKQEQKSYEILSNAAYPLSLSTLVLNSRDRYEKKWQPNFTRLKTRLRISNI